MEMETNYICRVCLSSREEKYMSLFENYKCFRVFEYINILSNVNIQESDGYPDKICKICFFNLETAIDFKEKCESSNILLKSQSINQKIPEDEDVKIVVKSEDEHIFELKLENKLEDDPTEGDIFESNDYEYEEPNKTEESFNENGFPATEIIGPQVQCHDCGVFFKSKCKLRVHWKKSHMFSFLICSICKRTFKTYRSLQSHLKKKNQSCVIASNENLLIEGQGRFRIFHCRECGYKTVRIKDMIPHLRIHSGEKPYECNLCKKKFTQIGSLITHKEYHKESKEEFTCQFCGKVVKGKKRLAEHVKSHTRKKIKCTVCKKFVAENYMKTHLIRHNGVKTYTCELCATSFYTLSELCNHISYVHKKTKLKQCPKCDYKVHRSDFLKKHMIKHTDKNFPCTTCGRFYPSILMLISHQVSHSGGVTCPICGKEFQHKDSVKRHISEKHIPFKERTTPCPICKKMFTHESSVKKHMSQKHQSHVSKSKTNAAKSNTRPKQSKSCVKLKDENI